MWHFRPGSDSHHDHLRSVRPTGGSGEGPIHERRVIRHGAEWPFEFGGIRSQRTIGTDDLLDATAAVAALPVRNRTTACDSQSDPEEATGSAPFADTRSKRHRD